MPRIKTNFHWTDWNNLLWLSKHKYKRKLPNIFSSFTTPNSNANRQNLRNYFKKRNLSKNFQLYSTVVNFHFKWEYVYRLTHNIRLCIQKCKTPWDFATKTRLPKFSFCSITSLEKYHCKRPIVCIHQKVLVNKDKVLHLQLLSPPHLSISMMCH